MQSLQSGGVTWHGQLDPFMTLLICFMRFELVSGALSLTTPPFHMASNGQSHPTLLYLQIEASVCYQIVTMLKNVAFFFLYSMDNRKCFQAGLQQPSCFDIENILAQSNNHAEIAVINCSIYRNVNNIYVLLVVLWTKSVCGLVFKKNNSEGRT